MQLLRRSSNWESSARATQRSSLSGASDSIITAMDSEIIFAVQESPEGGYEAHALGHAIFTQGDSMDELREMVRDAVRCHFDEGAAPTVIRLHFVHDEVISA